LDELQKACDGMAFIEYCIWVARAITGNLQNIIVEAAPSVFEAKPVVAADYRSQDQVVCLYEERVQELLRFRTQASVRRAKYLLVVLALSVALAVLLLLSFGIAVLPFWLAALPLLPGIVLLERARRSHERAREMNSLLNMYQRRLARAQHEWMGKGDPGIDLRIPDHLNARDLDLFGDGSMFELLCDVDTPAGRETLATWFQNPASRTEAVSRQNSIQSLRDRADLRERLALLREGEASEYSWNALREWLVADPVMLPRWTPSILPFLPLTIIIVAGCWWVGLLQGITAASLIAAIVVAEVALALFLRRRILSILSDLHLPARKVESLRRLCAFVREEHWESPKLVELQRKLRGSSELIAGLQRLVRLLNLRNSEFLIWPYLLVMGTTQIASRIERWRQRHGRELVEWITVLGEFEALMAIAAYAYENPDDPFPEFVDGTTLFEAKDLGHPLIDPRKCISNDLVLDRETRFLMVTGSNMSGKSTLLRAVGLNATLAWMGAPVRASQLRISRVQVCASIRIDDSLLDGASRFYAEVQRLKVVLDLARSGAPVLFLIDELFAGTNSADRRVAAEAVIRALLDHQAIGLVTSHDLALSEVGEMQELKGANVHFTDLATTDGPMKFDYRIHRGRLEHGNALKIIRLVGLVPE
jgi:ABC-type multidrug transport system fused ATPase/permease subunit